MSPNSQASNHEELRDLCGAYALGALDPPDLARFDEHLRAGCEICGSEVEAQRRVVGALGGLLEESTPPAAAEDRLMARLAAVGNETAVPAHGRGLWVHWLSAAAALLIVVPALWIAVESRSQIARLERLLAAFETTTDPLVSFTDLEPTAAAESARARATYDPRTQRWRVFLHDLVPPPAGRTYQGWLATHGGTLDFGTFLPDETGHAFLVMSLPDETEGIRIRVTLEPEGGSERPTGPAVFDHPGDGTSPS